MHCKGLKRKMAYAGIKERVWILIPSIDMFKLNWRPFGERKCLDYRTLIKTGCSVFLVILEKRFADLYFQIITKTDLSQRVVFGCKMISHNRRYISHTMSVGNNCIIKHDVSVNRRLPKAE